MHPLPAAEAGDRYHSGDRFVRGRAAGDRSRLQVRRPPIAGAAARRADEGSRGRGPRWCRDRRAGAAPPVAAARARVRSGGRSRAACRAAGRARARSDPADRGAGKPAGRPSPCQCAGCVCARAGRHPASRPRRRPRRRREHDGSHPGSLRPRPQCSRASRDSRAYGSASRVDTAVNTSAAIASFGRSPSSRTQVSASASRW